MRVDRDAVVRLQRQRRTASEPHAGDGAVAHRRAARPAALLERERHGAACVAPAADAPGRIAARPHPARSRLRPLAARIDPLLVAEVVDVHPAAAERDPITLHDEPGPGVQPVDPVLAGDARGRHELSAEPCLRHGPVLRDRHAGQPVPAGAARVANGADLADRPGRARGEHERGRTEQHEHGEREAIRRRGIITTGWSAGRRAATRRPPGRTPATTAP